MPHIEHIYKEFAHGSLKAHQPRETVTDFVLATLGFIAVNALLLSIMILWKL